MRVTWLFYWDLVALHSIAITNKLDSPTIALMAEDFLAEAHDKTAWFFFNIAPREVHEEHSPEAKA